jgi:hypothetical protein
MTFSPKMLEYAPDYWEVFEHFGVHRSLGIVKGIGWVEFQLPVIPTDLALYVADWKPIGIKVDLVLKNFWKSSSEEKHQFFETKMGNL